MLLTHRFGSVETLDRARYWLTRLGFKVAPSNFPGHDETRLAMILDLSMIPAALALIDSFELSDPHGWPGILDQNRILHVHGPHPLRSAMSESARPSAPIHWEARHEHPSSDPLCSKTCEYMLSH
jgi:hypothetical protein